ncbi:MAG: oxygen-independent coproporphyrinogen III oxidase [Methylotenera sp.]|nr:oxygen-independent coproporphyrinogen III oxidase [Oligoflexia bacterium]
MNLTLLRKYNVPGPRYTSYPTVPYWDTDPTVKDWIRTISERLDESEKSGTGAAIYVHVPFCKSLCTYCGCNTRITRNSGAGTPYVLTVLKEWETYRKMLGRDQLIPITELHLGGGTPTFLSPEDLRILVEGILKHGRKTENAEFSVEADPRVTTKEQLETLTGLGFRRLSLGIQDFDPKVQDIVNRVQTFDEVKRVTDQARAAGFTSVNYDLIYGLPLQTLQSVEDTIDQVILLRPDRIAFYGYAHVPWIKPGQRRFTENDLPAGDDKRALYELGRQRLEQAGYLEVGMDHFALSTDSLWKASLEGTLHRNFMGYTSRYVAPLIGLGVSSIGDSWEIFTQNEKHLEAYVAKVEAGEIPFLRGHRLNSEDQVIRKHILNLMTRFSTSWESADLQTDSMKQVPEKLAELARDGLVKLSTQSCEITELGRPFIRNICMAFDARLARKAPTTQLFSRTI